MSKKKELQTKALAAVMATSMVTSLCPATVFAVTGEQVAKDGTYAETVHVINNPDDENDWEEYDVTVELKVEDGKFSAINVTPGNTYDKGESGAYFDKAVSKSKGIATLLVGQPATENTVNSWDTVSGATCTSKAIKEAALKAIGKAEEKQVQVSVDTTALEAAISDAEGLTQTDYTEASWSAMQEKLTAAKAALEAKESQEAVTTAATQLTEAINALEKNATDPVEKPEYVLMNIPYADFYKAEVNNDVDVDAFSSATLNKTRTASLAGGSYHVNSDGSDITGITFPVKVSDGVDLSAFKKVTDEDSVTITVTNRGQTSTATYAGRDALFENASYAYYVLDEAPSYYKEVTVDGEGNVSFGKVTGEEAQTVNVEAELSTETSYGDYQLDIYGLDMDINTDKIYGVVVSTKEGNDYGMRHLENIWRGTELAWSTGFTTAVHNCPTSSDHYKEMMGQTINKVTYYTSKGIYEMPMDVYVPVKFDYTLSVEDASVSTGSTRVELTGLPEGYDAQYSVDGLEGAVEDGVLTFTNAAKGKYTLTVKDGSGKYAGLSTDFILYTEDMPAAYNGDNSAPALIAADGFTAEDLADYIKNIDSVTVNGESYAASGRGAVVIINEDGSIKTDAAPFTGAGTYEITVSSVGYEELQFIYTIEEDKPIVNEIDTTALQEVIQSVSDLKESDYTEESWAALQEKLAAAQEALETKESQEAVNAAQEALENAIAGLEKTEEPAEDPTEDPTDEIDTAALEKVIAQAKALKESDYTADSWKNMQSALTKAEEALKAEESQSAVDAAAKELQSAIDDLKKKTSGTAQTNNTNNTNNNSKSTGNSSNTGKTSTASNAKTGDVTNIWGWMGLAISSLGIGGLGLKVRRKSKKEEKK